MTACTRCQTALEDGDLRCAICALPVPVAVRPGDGKPYAQVLRCRECGAVIAFSPVVQAPHCGFCGATMAIEQPVDPIEEAQLQLPFSVDRAGAEAALRVWLSTRGWFAPHALSSDAVFESLTPLWWAAWLVNAQARVTWTADSDAGAQRSAWAPHAGETSMGFHNIVVPASRGLRDVEARLLIPYYDLTSVVSIGSPRSTGGDAAAVGASPEPTATPGAMNGAIPEAMNGTVPGTMSGTMNGAMHGAVPQAAPEAMIERFDAQRSAARRHVQNSIDALAKVRIEPRIPGRRYRNVRVACLLERQTTDRIALPAWILAYRFRGNAYRAVVHGQRAELVFGRSPIDWRKVGWLVAIGAIVAAIIALIIAGVAR